MFCTFLPVTFYSTSGFLWAQPFRDKGCKKKIIFEYYIDPKEQKFTILKIKQKQNNLVLDGL